MIFACDCTATCDVYMCLSAILFYFIENDWKELETTGKDYNILETTENDLNRLEMTGNDVSTRFHLFPLLWKIIFLPIFTE